jgi:hypothetical protein
MCYYLNVHFQGQRVNYTLCCGDVDVHLQAFNISALLRPELSCSLYVQVFWDVVCRSAITSRRFEGSLFLLLQGLLAQEKLGILLAVLCLVSIQ